MKIRYLTYVLILLVSTIFTGCNSTKEAYYEIPKSEVVDVSSSYKENINLTVNDDIEETKSNKYFTYKNERFGFSVDVPDYLKPYSESDNNDGLYFETTNGDTYLSVYGSNYPNVNYDYPNINDIYMDELAGMAYTPKFTEKNYNSFKISWEEYNTAYWKKYYLKSDSTENVLIISYPLSKAKEYEDDIKHILESFKTGFGYDSNIEE